MFSIEICLGCQMKLFKKLFKKKVLILILILLVILYFYNSRENLSISKKSKHKLGVVIPFRNRFNQLKKFVPYMTKYLNNQNLNFEIFVINQIDDYRFNRASLINVGFIISQKFNCDYIAMHDVDLIPKNNQIKYAYPENGPLHLSAPGLHPRYDYPTFVGGILLINKFHFKKVNGMSNKYWGWGLEDDEFYQRLKKAKIEIYRPKSINSDKKNTFIHMHYSGDKRDRAKLYNQKEVTKKIDYETGLNNVNFKIEDSINIKINGSNALVYDIKLKCNYDKTPWCKFPKNSI